MLRRTACVSRYPERRDDDALVRHIYDTYHLQQSQAFGMQELAELIVKGVVIDRERYGNQHPEFVADPIGELRYGLDIICNDPVYQARYKAFVNPMVYGDKLSWEDAIEVFKHVSNQVLAHIDAQKLLNEA